MLKIIDDPNPNGSDDFQRFTPIGGGENESLKSFLVSFLAMINYWPESFSNEY